MISVPLIGSIDVAGQTVQELQDNLSMKLQARVGLAQRPSTAIQIIKYRPFYVAGEVQNPGEYEYRPNLTVLQAISIAGGLTKLKGLDLLSTQKDAVTLQGDVSSARMQLIAIAIRHARLKAEAGGLSKIVYPNEIAKNSSESEVQSLKQDEEMLFDLRRRNIDSKIKVLSNAKSVLTSQIIALNEKDENAIRQSDLARKEVKQMTELLSKGLVNSPRQLSAEQSLATFESLRIDTQIAKLRAQQDLSKVDRDIIDSKETFQADALNEATQAANKEIDLKRKLSSSQKALSKVELVSASLAGSVNGTTQVIYEVLRQGDARATTSSISGNDLIGPGDVLNVRVQQTESTNLDGTYSKKGSNIADGG